MPGVLERATKWETKGCCAQWVMQAFLKTEHLTQQGQVRNPEPPSTLGAA